MCRLCKTYEYSNTKDFNEKLPKVWKRVMKQLHNGTFKSGDVSPELCMLMAKELFHGVDTGGLSFDITDPTQARKLKTLQQNIFYFSGFKTQKELKEASTLLTDDKGNVKPFSQFLTDVKAINKTYNTVYLKAEYNNAIASAQMMKQWQDIQATKDIFPWLKYQTAHDERVRDSHRVLDNVTKPVGDAFWKTYYPPNGWNCRCHVIKLAHGKNSGDYVAPVMPEMFKGNVGIDGIIFPDTHPYFEASKSEVKKVGSFAIVKFIAIDKNIKEYQKLIKQNYIHQYLDPATGGFVVSHPEHGKDELEENVLIGKIYAFQGKRVQLEKQIKIDGIKSHDAFVDGVKWEFKSAGTQNLNTIQGKIRYGSKQAPNLTIHFKLIPDIENVIEFVRLSVRYGYFKRLKVLELYVNNKPIVITRKIALTGGYVDKIMEAYKK